MAAVNPLEAQRVFRANRTAFSVLSYSIGPIGLAALYSYGASFGEGLFILIATGFLVVRFLYFSKMGSDLLLRATAVQVFCPECNKNVPRLADWHCGYCDCENKNQIAFPIVYRCEHCEEAPKSFECWNCEKPIFFSADRDAHNPARVSGKKPRVAVAKIALKPIEAPAPVPTLDPIELKTKDHVLKKTDLLHEIEITQLKAQLEQVKASAPYKEELSVFDRLEKEYTKHDAELIGYKMLARNKRKEWDETLKNEPELRKDKEEALRDFLESKGFSAD